MAGRQAVLMGECLLLAEFYENQLLDSVDGRGKMLPLGETLVKSFGGRR